MSTTLMNRFAMSRDILKFSCLRLRNFDGFFASMHQSGNHWLRHILSTVLADHYDLPPPVHLRDMRLVGEPRLPTAYAAIPRLVFSHKICSPLVHCRLMQALLRFPRYVILVRDMRATLVSHYERFKTQYAVPFPQYLKGDVFGRRYDCDIWDSVRFLNAWGGVREQLPETVTVCRYEDLQTDTVSEVLRLLRFLDCGGIGRPLVERAVAESTKDKMVAKERQGRHGAVVRVRCSDPLSSYSESDQRFFQETCEQYLRYSFGYDYSSFAPPVEAVAA